jgi:hypothetical protein
MKENLGNFVKGKPILGSLGPEIVWFFATV